MTPLKSTAVDKGWSFLEHIIRAIRHGLVLKDMLEEKISLLPIKKTLTDRFLPKVAAEFLRLDDTHTS